MIVAQFTSVLIYFGSIFIFKNMINVAFINWTFFFKILITSLVSWLPLHILRKFKSRYFPTDYEKIMKSCRKKSKDISYR
jgi:hypothetical protein